jgi:lysophospholipase
MLGAREASRQIENELARMNLTSIPENPIPETGSSAIIKARDGRRLRYARWAASKKTIGTICVFQGRAEFIEKYFETITELRTRGFDVITWDWRGQGASQRVLPDPNRGYVEDFDEYQIDFDTIMDEVIIPKHTRPLIALAHSMGAAVLIRASKMRERLFECAILTAPMIGLQGLWPSGVARATFHAARALGYGNSYIPFGQNTPMDLRTFAGNRRTSDPERYSRNAKIVAANPGLGLGSPTIAWTTAALDAMHKNSTNRNVKHPAFFRSLFIATSEDKITNSSATREYAASQTGSHYVCVTGARHELLMERNEFRMKFWSSFDAFVGQS